MSIPLPTTQPPHRTPLPLCALLDRVVPDTDSALPSRYAGEAAMAGVLWQRQRQREAEILRQTRILIGQGDQTAFSIRKVAENCDLAPQTVYNLIGDREQLIAAAISQHVQAMVGAARALDGPPGFFMAFADVLWAHALKNPAYAKTVTRTQFASRCEAARNIKAILNGVFRAELTQLAECGALRESVDIVLVAERMQSLILMTAIGWAESSGDDIALRQQLVGGLGLLLLGAMKASARGPIEAWTDAVQARNTGSGLPRVALSGAALRC